MSEAKTYTGGCHCGAVRYQVTTDLTPVVSCNCSMCQRAGTWLTFVSTEAFTLQSGEDALTDYQFNTHRIHHLFCSTCGIKSFARGPGPGGKPMVAVNVRCLDDMDLTQLHPTEFDGRSM